LLTALIEAALIALALGRHPVWAFTAAGLFYLIAVASVVRLNPQNPQVPRIRLRWILLAALVFRITLLPLPPSPQLARFRWEGKILHQGFNPYAFAPSNTLFNPIRDPADALVPEPGRGSFHPPVAEYAFHWSYLWSKGPRTQKIFFTVFDLLLILALAAALDRRGRPREWAIVYAFSPLAVLAVAGRGHMEAVAGFFLLLALDWAALRPAWAGIFAALAAMTQWYALLLVPQVLTAAAQRWRRTLLWGLALGVLVWLPYAFAAQHQALTAAAANVAGHLHLPAVHASLFAVARAWFGLPAAAALSLAVVASAILLSLRAPQFSAVVAVLGAVLVASPWVHPWMVLWLLPFLAFDLEPAWLVFSVTVVWPSPWASYLPLYALLAYQLWRRPKGTPLRTANA